MSADHDQQARLDNISTEELEAELQRRRLSSVFDKGAQEHQRKHGDLLKAIGVLPGKDKKP